MSHLNNDNSKIMDLSEDNINFSHQGNYIFLDYSNFKNELNNKEEEIKYVKIILKMKKLVLINII